MPLNLLTVYPKLLDLESFTEKERTKSLYGVFRRDIEDNPDLAFRLKKIRPIKGEEPAMIILFRHLTTEEVEVSNEDGSKYVKRIFEMTRSKRLHWVRFHIEERKTEGVSVFSVLERDQKKRKDIIRTYIYDAEQKYIIVLDPQRSKRDYYLVTAYYLNKDYGEKKIKKLYRNRLAEVY
jgi:hypothetical protein